MCGPAAAPGWGSGPGRGSSERTGAPGLPSGSCVEPQRVGAAGIVRGAAPDRGTGTGRGG